MHYVDEVFITIPSERDIVKTVAHQARLHRLDVKVVPDFYDGIGWNAPIRQIGPFPVMELHREPIPFTGLLLKRLVDLVGSALALLFLSPLLALIALGIRLDSSGPVIYRSRRMGKKGREFVCYKFRTMVANADALKAELLARNERRGPFFKMANDPRITRLGSMLRKYSLDELPQFWNVFLGNMSLVGPRPHPIDEYEKYTLEHRRRLDVKPGITGLWQVTARRDPAFETSMVLDLEYIENWTLALDLRILLRTFAVVARGDGE
jgi:exopolysaccharide biosynthesis polyprenyl glycosylphosphotransferase